MLPSPALVTPALLVLLACTWPGATATGKDKPCLARGQIKDCLFAAMEVSSIGEKRKITLKNNKCFGSGTVTRVHITPHCDTKLKITKELCGETTEIASFQIDRTLCKVKICIHVEGDFTRVCDASVEDAERGCAQKDITGKCKLCTYEMEFNVKGRHQSNFCPPNPSSPCREQLCSEHSKCGAWGTKNLTKCPADMQCRKSICRDDGSCGLDTEVLPLCPSTQCKPGVCLLNGTCSLGAASATACDQFKTACRDSVCSPDGICELTKEQSRPCASSECYPATCDDKGSCIQGARLTTDACNEECGDDWQACCVGSSGAKTCKTSDLACSLEGSMYKCLPCGFENKPACTGPFPCAQQPNLEPVAGICKRKPGCGQDWELCCQPTNSVDSTVRKLLTVTTVTLGTCASPELACVADATTGMQKCFTCGYEQGPACTGQAACRSDPNLESVGGICVRKIQCGLAWSTCCSAQIGLSRCVVAGFGCIENQCRQCGGQWQPPCPADSSNLAPFCNDPTLAIGTQNGYTQCWKCGTSYTPACTAADAVACQDPHSVIKAGFCTPCGHNWQTCCPLIPTTGARAQCRSTGGGYICRSDLCATI